MASSSCEATADNIHERIRQYALIPISGLVIFSNVAVLVYVALERMFYRPTYWFIISLVLADICVGIVSVGTIATKANESTLTLCLIRIGFTICALQASALCILWVAIDRMIAITHALRYDQIMTSQKAIVGIIAIWIQSILVGFSPLFGWNNSDYQHYCSFLYVVPKSYVMFLFIVGLLPIGIVFVIYIKLYRNARIHIRRIEALHHIGVVRRHSGPFGISYQNWKSMKTLLVVLVCLFVTWCPFFLATAVQMLCGDDTCCLKTVIGTHLLLLGFSNSFLNPIIYAFRTKEFRNKFKLVFKKRCTT